MNNLFDRPLFVGAHVDDIELFAGGTLSRFSSSALCITFSKHDGLLTAMPWKEVREGKDVYPEVNWQVRDFNAVDGSIQKGRERIAENLRYYLSSSLPTVVVTHQSSDTNQDHRTIYEEVIRTFKGKVPILCGSFPNNDISQVKRTFFVGISGKDLRRKILAIKKYKSQMVPGREYLNSSQSLVQAKFWGAYINQSFAEAFEVVRLWI